MLLLSRDAEKAFDNVNWIFLTETLGHIGFGQQMMNWIQAIDSPPSAQVKVNGHLYFSKRDLPSNFDPDFGALFAIGQKEPGHHDACHMMRVLDRHFHGPLNSGYR